MSVAALIPAAGQGLRMKNEKNKQFMMLGDRPVLAHTLALFTSHPEIQKVLLMGRPEELASYHQLVEEYSNPRQVQVLPGGKERADTVWKGLLALGDVDYVLIHDGARPLLPSCLLHQVLSELKSWEAVVPGLPILDTVKVVLQDVVQRTIPRETLRAVQTPQAFRFQLIFQAYKAGFTAGFLGSDDVSYLERVYDKIKVIPGSWENIKMTTPMDLLLGEMILQDRERREEGT